MMNVLTYSESRITHPRKSYHFQMEQIRFATLMLLKYMGPFKLSQGQIGQSIFSPKVEMVSLLKVIKLMDYF